MRRLLVAAIAICACSSSVNFAGLESGPRKVTYQEKTFVRHLANGLRVAVSPDDRTNLVTVTVRYNVGGADDPAGQSGLAHYVEHVLWEAPLRGTRDDVSLDGNAMTELDRTYFYTIALDADVEHELEIAAQRFELGCQSLDEASLARERDVVVEEMKQRASPWSSDVIMAAIWGSNHPYAHNPGGSSFRKEDACAFLEQHYGPSSATLVVTGHVDDKLMDRIVARFDKIPGRTEGPRAPTPPRGPPTPSLTVHGLERPTAMMIFDVPREGSGGDAAVQLAQHVEWKLPAARVPFVTMVAMGEERARVLVAFAEVDDVAQLPGLVAAMKERFSRPRVPNFETYRQHERQQFIERFDDQQSAAFQIADLMVRAQSLSRFRELKEIDALREDDVTSLLDASKARVVTLIPEEHAGHHVTEVATTLHDLTITRTQTSDATLPTSRPTKHEVDEYQLENGLRVWLAPDPNALGLDARLVIGTTPRTDDTLAWEAGLFLRGSPGDAEANKRIQWYGTIGSAVTARTDTDHTTFAITGLALFGDWHVWNLAWTVVQGVYPPELDRVKLPAAAPKTAKTPATMPSALAIASLRLDGKPDDEGAKHVELFHTDELERYRRQTYLPSASVLIVSGKFDVAAMRSEIASLFGMWHGPTAVKGWKYAKPPPRIGNVEIPVEDADTVEIAIGFASATESPRSEKAARDVLSEILNDRLRVIRESLGVSYGISAHITTTGVLISGDVEPAYSTAAAHALADEIGRIRAGYPDMAADFARARKHVLARALADPVGASNRAAQLEGVVIDHMQLDQPDKDLEALRTLDLETVKNLATRELRQDRMIAVMRGPLEQIHQAMDALGVDRATVKALKP
ncbi:MAG: insulinase family protein [Kofleriaceae bacterium]